MGTVFCTAEGEGSGCYATQLPQMSIVHIPQDSERKNDDLLHPRPQYACLYLGSSNECAHEIVVDLKPEPGDVFRDSETGEEWEAVKVRNSISMGLLQACPPGEKPKSIPRHPIRWYVRAQQIKDD